MSEALIVVLVFLAGAAWMYYHPGHMHWLWLLLMIVIYGSAVLGFSSLIYNYWR